MSTIRPCPECDSDAAPQCTGCGTIRDDVLVTAETPAPADPVGAGQGDGLTQDEIDMLASHIYDEPTHKKLAFVVFEVNDILADRLAARAAGERGLRERVEALLAEWETTAYYLPPAYPMTVDEFCIRWFKGPLRAALDGAGGGEGLPETPGGDLTASQGSSGADHQGDSSEGLNRNDGIQG